MWFYPILDKIMCPPPPPPVTLTVPPLDSETGWTGELLSKTNSLKKQKIRGNLEKMKEKIKQYIYIYLFQLLGFFKM